MLQRLLLQSRRAAAIASSTAAVLLETPSTAFASLPTPLHVHYSGCPRCCKNQRGAAGRRLVVVAATPDTDSGGGAGLFYNARFSLESYTSVAGLRLKAYGVYTLEQRAAQCYSSASSSESSSASFSGRKKLRLIGSDCVSSRGGRDIVVSCGTHGGGVEGHAALPHKGSDFVLFETLPRSRRNTIHRKPLLPVEPRNLREPGLRRKKKRRGRGDKCRAKGIRLKRDQQGRFKGPRSRTFEGGKTPLYRRLPKWPAAWLGRRHKSWEHLNLAKLRRFLEHGRLDARFPITQRHLHDSRCVKVRNGVHLFNVNDYPFPYKIIVDVASADQSSIDAIRKVGGEVRIVYRHPINLRAHVKPYKFDVLPKTARPGLEAVHYLEKMRARGCVVSYIKPQWLEAEERRLQAELQELQAEAAAADGLGTEPGRSIDAGAIAAYRAKGLQIASLEEQGHPKSKH